MPIRRHTLFALGALAAALLHAAPAAAQTAIDKTLKIVVGFPAGGAADVVARLLAEQLRGHYAPSVIVENKTGAAGRLAAQAVKNGPRDGSQILISPASVLTIYPHVYKKLGYDTLKDFTPVGSVAKVTFAFSVSSAVPAEVKTVGDYVKWAKAQPHGANFGSPAAGATPHFVGTMLGNAAQVKLLHVPFNGGAPLVSSLLGGQVQAGVNVMPEVVQHAQGGKLRVLAVSNAKRSPFLPDVPTFAESGFDVQADEYFAAFAPAGTPRALVEKLNAAIGKALQSPKMQEGLKQMSFEAGGESVQAFEGIIAAELKRWGPLVQASGFSSDD